MRALNVRTKDRHANLPAEPRLALHFFCQQKTAAPAASQAQEFPVVIQQSVSAGKTAFGTKVQAKLEIATWVEGKVAPRNARDVQAFPIDRPDCAVIKATFNRNRLRRFLRAPA
jgi:hypothetical protein